MKASGYVRVDDDFYVEPRWVVDALLNVEPFDGVCWDPACGSGTIPKALAERGMLYHGSDIADRGYGTTGHDFMESSRRAENIICNPPYGIIQTWVERALLLTTGKVAIIARLAFLEGMKRRDTFWDHVPLARVWICSRRPSMPPGNRNIRASNGSVAYAWFVFVHGHADEAVVKWLP